MAKQWIHVVTVAPVNVELKLNFPVDMLRQEGLYPTTTHDAIKMATAIKKYLDPNVYNDTWIMLSCVAPKPWKANDKRWRSFGWMVAKQSINSEY